MTRYRSWQENDSVKTCRSRQQSERGDETVTVGLVPQDEITLSLLARVLAKMYRRSLYNEGDPPAESARTGAGAPDGESVADRQAQSTPEPASTQIE